MQGYTILAQGNAQLVSNPEGIILATDVTQEANDVGQLHPMLAKA